MLRYKGEWYGCNVLKLEDLIHKSVENSIKAFAFDRQSLIENLGNSRVGRTQINAQGEDKVAALCGSGLQ